MIKTIIGAAFALTFLGFAGSAHATPIDTCDDTSTAFVTCEGNLGDNGFDISKDWHDVPTEDSDYHQFNTGVLFSSTYSFTEDVVNNTGSLWTDYHVTFDYSPVTTGSFQSAAFDIDVLATIETHDCVSSSTSCEVWIFFGSPLGTGDVFTFSGDFEFDVDGTMTVTQYPTIPEPGTLGLFAIGLAGLGVISRRRRKLGI